MSGIAVGKCAAREASRWGTRACAAILCATLSVQPVLSQSASPANPGAGQSAPTRLQINVLSPVPLSEPAGGLSANQVVVEVMDGWGMPVPGTTVSFRLPEAGPGGVFLNGLSTEVAITDREGKAAIQGFDWREEPGASFLHVIAAYGEIRAGAMVEVQLRRKVEALPPAATVSKDSPSAPVTRAPSAFPLPEESQAVRTTAAPPIEPQRKQKGGRVVIGQTASDSSVEPTSARAAIPNPTPAAPREIEPPAPSADYQAPNATDTPSYVTVKRKSGGGNKMLLILLVAAAAAGGAVAAGVAGAGASGPGGNGSGNPTPAGITIGSPSITVTGGGN